MEWASAYAGAKRIPSAAIAEQKGIQHERIAQPNAVETPWKGFPRFYELGLEGQVQKLVHLRFNLLDADQDLGKEARAFWLFRQGDDIDIELDIHHWNC